MGKKNDSRNVSTTRFLKGGYCFVAPEGTDVPENLTDKLDDAFNCTGFFSEDGFKEGVDGSDSTLVDANGDTVDTYSEGTTETLAMTLIEMSDESLAVQYGHKNVEKRDKMIVVDHNWGNAEENLAVVLEMILKNGRRWRKVIKSAKVTERGEVTGNSTTATGREVTLTYITDDEGSGCKDYIEAIDDEGEPGGADDASSAMPLADDASSAKPLDDMTIDELKAYAEEHGIDLEGKTLKADILEAVKGSLEADHE